LLKSTLKCLKKSNLDFGDEPKYSDLSYPFQIIIVKYISKQKGKKWVVSG